MSWNFGEPASGAANTSTLINPVHAYASLGTFTTQLILSFPCRTDTFRQVVTVSTTDPTFTLSGRTSICKTQSSVLSATAASSQGVMTYSWSSTTAQGNSVSVTPTITTTYTVTGKTAAGCMVTNTIQVAVNPCTAIEEQMQASLANIFPNPSTGLFYIESHVAGSSYEIYNNLGLLVLKGLVKEQPTSIDLNNHANGVYFARIKSGEVITVKKLIKSE